MVKDLIRDKKPLLKSYKLSKDFIYYDFLYWGLIKKLYKITVYPVVAKKIMN